MSNNFHLKNLKHLPYGSASCVTDPDMDQEVHCAISLAGVNQCLKDTGIQDRFTDDYYVWINNSKFNQLNNLDKFPIHAFSNGTTESFDKFYLKNSTRRFRCFRGEYMYHGASWKINCPRWKYLDDEPVDGNDAVVISLPFSDTGNIHERTQEILDICSRLGVPVLIDCAFIGISSNIIFNFDQPCITDIVFSLSKSFPLGHLRIGMRLTRYDDDDSLLIHKKTNYTNRLGAFVGSEMMLKYSVDYNVNRWKEKQLEFCRQLEVIPSNSIIFGLGDERFKVYNRGGLANRLNFAEYLYQGVLPND